MVLTKAARPTVVIDNGGYELRAGHPGDDKPCVAMPSIVGQPLNAGVAMAAGLREYEIGFEAQARRGVLTCSEPIQSGVIKNWDAMEKLWTQVIFRELQIVPENFTFVITQSPNTPKEQKEKTLELLMETFNAHSLYLGIAPVFALYSYGKTTGVALDVGLDTSSAVPIYEGYCLPRHVVQCDVGGRTMTNFLLELLKQQGYDFGTMVEQNLISDVKEKLCYVAKNEHTFYGQSCTPITDRTSKDAAYFYLPDGQPIPLNEEKYKCPEALFDFSVLGPKYIPKCRVFTDEGEVYKPSIAKGISWLTYSAINNCEINLQPTLLDNIVLCGGSSLFSGTRGRVNQELQHFYREIRPHEPMTSINVEGVACRKYSAWLGGCMLSSLSMFKHLTVSRREYEEHGKRIIHCKNL